MERLDYANLIVKFEEKIKYFENIEKLYEKLKIDHQNLINENVRLNKLIDENSTKGYIYECKIIDDNGEFYYIGWTNDLNKRIINHLSEAKRNPKCTFHSKLNEINFDKTKYEFKQIIEFDKILKYDLFKAEKKEYFKYKNENKNLLNDIEIFLGNKEEYKKEYYKQNKDKILENQKEYNELNKVKIKE